MPTVPRIEAPAKLNWTLDVLGRRPDGYHEIASVMATLSLKDTIELEPAATWRIDVEAGADLHADLAENGNIMERAIAEAAAAWGRANGEPDAQPAWPPARLPAARLRLTKRIPAAAGLGGGSSDAAATLRLVSEYWQQEMQRAGRRARGFSLEETAARVGSDVPFFFVPTGTALAEGRGERLRQLRPFTRQWLVVLAPPIPIARKTARLYGLLRPEHFSRGERSRVLAHRARSGEPAAATEQDITNVFDAVAEEAFPGLAGYRALLTDVTGAPAHLCGAGPALFALTPGFTVAYRAAERLKAEGHEAYAVGTPA